MNTLLDVRDLKAYFISRTETVKAVSGVSFTVNEGETFGLVGESGCGKSATCRAIAQLLKKPGKIVGGEIFFEGADLLKSDEKYMKSIRGKKISMIFQEPMTSLNPLLTIKSQIFDALDKNVYRSREQKYEKTVDLLRLVGIPSPEARLNDYPHQFSGGMRQRAMIAIALCSNPKLVLADEPTTALDVTIQDQIMKLLMELKEKIGMSVILVTHDLGVVAQMCDRVAVMYAGMIFELTDTASLFTKPRHPYTHALMNSIPTRINRNSDLETIQGAPPNLSDLPDGCPFTPRCKFAEASCREKLDELFEIEKGHFTRCHRTEIISGFEGFVKVPEDWGRNQ